MIRRVLPCPTRQTRRPLPAVLVAAWVLASGMNGAWAEGLAPDGHTDPGSSLSREHSEAPSSAATSTWTQWVQPGATLQRLSTSLLGLWARVQPKLNVVLEPPSPSPLSSLGFDRPANATSRLRNFQLFTNCSPESGGFRATAGLLRADTNSWWAPSSDNAIGSPNLSVQRLSASGVLPSTSLLPTDPVARGTRPYLGAGYSSGQSANGSASLWRFNADLGLMSLNNGNAGQVSQVLSGERSFDDVVHELRFRPNIKVSVGYSF